MKHPTEYPIPDIPVVGVDPTTVTQIVPQSASIAALLAVIAGWLPVIVAIIPALYYLVLIYETKTVQGWVSHWRERRAARKLAKAKAAALKAEALVTAQIVKIEANATAKSVTQHADVEAARVLAEAKAKADALKSNPLPGPAAE